MSIANPETMPDIQSTNDSRGIPLDAVGVRDLLYPITILDQNNQRQEVVARISMAVNLPHHFKGTHMSRFIEALNEHKGELTLRTLPDFLNVLRQRLEAECAQVECDFPYFIERVAPVSGSRGLMDYQCSFSASLSPSGGDFSLGVDVPVASLCPCSKEISDYGAHNQRGHVKISVKSRPDEDGRPSVIWIEELVEIAESAASAPLYPLLKRSDERHVTMQAYDNPVFVEDLARGVAQRLMQDDRVASFDVEIVNLESIHNHNAFACVRWQRPTSIPKADFSSDLGATTSR